MPHVLDEFRTRRELTRNLTHTDDRIRLLGLLEWLESEIQTKPILDTLRRKIDAQTLIPKTTGFPHPPSASTPTEVQAFGLFLLEGCKRPGHGLHTQAHSYNIRPSGAKSGRDYI